MDQNLDRDLQLSIHNQINISINSNTNINNSNIKDTIGINSNIINTDWWGDDNMNDTKNNIVQTNELMDLNRKDIVDKMDNKKETNNENVIDDKLTVIHDCSDERTNI